MKKSKNVVQSTKEECKRQGDVLAIKLNATSVPNSTKQTKQIIAAFGEVTGHSHQVLESGAVGYADTDNADLIDYLQVDAEKTVNLVHQEHTAIPLDTGIYEVLRQTEYTPQGLRNVAD